MFAVGVASVHSGVELPPSADVRKRIAVRLHPACSPGHSDDAIAPGASALRNFIDASASAHSRFTSH